MRVLTQLLISPWLLCPLLGLVLIGGSLVDYPPLLQLEYPIYDQLMEFRNTSGNSRVVLISSDQDSNSAPGNDIDSSHSLVALVNKVRQLGGRDIALLTPPRSVTQKFPVDLTLNNRHKNKPVILAATSNRPSTLFSEIPFTNSLITSTDPLPDPKKLLLNLQNPLAHYRLNRPEKWRFLSGKPGTTPTFLTGHLIFFPDSDGKIRSQPLLISSKNSLLPSLPLQLAIQAQGEDLQKLQIIPAELTGTLKTSSLQIPVIGFYHMLFNLHPEQPSFQIYSGSDLLQNKLKENVLQNKVILIGPTNSYGDRHQVAGYGNLSTSELAALTTATLLENSAPQRPSWGWLAEVGILLYFVILLILLIPRLSGRAGAMTLLLFLSGWILIAAVSLIIFGIWLRIIPPIVLCLVGFVLVRWHIGHRERDLHRQENYRVLAQRFQEQGLLDLALEKALLIEPKTKPSKTTLYNLGLEFERKRMPHNAISIYQHLLQGGRFRDTKKRLRQLEDDNGTTSLSKGSNDTVVLSRSGEKPTLGRYQIERELGQGAMGTVYLGLDPKINRQVAIKTLAYQPLDSEELPQIKERFFREAEAAGNLSHPNIVTIYDVGEEADLAFFAMEFLAGKDLSCYCSPKRRLPVAQVINIILQTASALDYAHQQGVIHRDIKPANLILLPEGQIKVTDFGIARITTNSQTETGIILGTPNYMSPEQVAGKKVDGRSDLFSLGVVMYELLSGVKPFQGESLTALMYNISSSNYQSLKKSCPRLPALCYTIVDKLLQKTLTRRFKSAAALQRELLALKNKLGPS